MSNPGSESTSVSPSPSAPSLLRALGPYTAMAVVVGNVIGSGIFLKPGTIAHDSGNFTLIISMWVLGGVLCILGGLCVAELSASHPKAGGLYVYLREAYGPFVAFMFGWTEVIFSRPASIAALAIAFLGRVSKIFDVHLTLMGQVGISTCVILGFAWINVVGVRWGGWTQLFITVVKVAFLVLVILSPFLLAPFFGWKADASNYSTTVSTDKSLLSQMAVVLLAVMWAYNGWHGITPLAEEVRSPQRNLPLALLGGIGLLIVLYVTANLTYHAVLPMNVMAAEGQNATTKVIEVLAGPGGQIAIALVIAFSVFGAINTNLLQSPRVPFAMGRDGFFTALGKVHATYRTPVISILTTSTFAILLIVAFGIGKALVGNVSTDAISWELGRKLVDGLKNDSIFDLLTNLAIFSSSLFYLMAVLAVMVLRYRKPDLERPYRTWGYPVTPILYVVTYVFFLSGVYLDKPLEANVGLVLIALGIPVFYALRKRSDQRGDPSMPSSS